MAEYDQTEEFHSLRLETLTIGTRHLDSELEVLALLMETGTADAVASLSVIADGSVDFFFSNGGGIIGADDHQQIRDEAVSLLGEAKNFLGDMTPTEQFPLPEQGSTRFYAVTHHGIFTTEGLETDMDYERHHLSPLFFQAHRLISFLRMVDELSRAIKASADKNLDDYDPV